MTVAVAVKKGGRTVLGADSLVHFGGQRYPPANCRFHKIFPIGDSVLVWAGWSLYAELLGAHLGVTASTPPQLHSEAEVFSFFIKFWRVLRQDYTLRNSPPTSDHPFADLDSTFLLANNAGIFRVSSDMDVTQFEQYCAVGSGSKYALGALGVLYGQLDDPGEIARRAVQVGIDFDVHCGGSIDLVEVVYDAAGTATTSHVKPSKGDGSKADANSRAESHGRAQGKHAGGS